MRHTSRPPVCWLVNYWPLLALWLLSGSAIFAIVGVVCGAMFIVGSLPG